MVLSPNGVLTLIVLNPISSQKPKIGLHSLPTCYNGVVNDDEVNIINSNPQRRGRGTSLRLLVCFLLGLRRKHNILSMTNYYSLSYILIFFFFFDVAMMS